MALASHQMKPAHKSYVLHRKLDFIPPEISHGKGVHLFDVAGRKYLDACGGAAVSCLGHSDPFVIDAIRTQLDSIAYVHSGFFTSRVTEELADKVVGLAGGTARAALFFSSGSEAMEAALKIARQFHLENGEPSRKHIISRKQSYHGTTIGALAVGGLWNRQQPFSDWLMTDHVSQVDACYPYRQKHKGEDEREYSARLVSAFEDEILRIGPTNIAAFVAETVTGATLGVVPPTPRYFAGIRKVCDRYGILLLLDEIMCGMGRCGDWLACHRENISPDIACIAKGLGGGYQPIGAMIVNEKVFRAISNNSGAFMHGQTYMGHATTCAAALAVVTKIEQENLIPNVADLGISFGKLLSSRFGSHPHVGEIRGRGFFWGIELVSDRETKSPFPKEAKLHQEVKRQAMANGLMVYAGGGALENGTGDHVLLSPPYVTSLDQLTEISDRLHDSVDAALKIAGLN